MTLTGGGSMFELRRGLSATSLDGGGEEEEGEETEAEEDLLPCFNPKKAHEVFIWMALNGASPEVGRQAGETNKGYAGGWVGG